jgi:hypothetical protein
MIRRYAWPKMAGYAFGSNPPYVLAFVGKGQMATL